MAIRQDGPQVTEAELQYARRVLRVLAALIEEGDPEVVDALRRLGAALGAWTAFRVHATGASGTQQEGRP